ncbi:MAG: hypothetical protein QXJ28_01205 [Candidatus Pacearchaeota archaeon]
MKKIFCFILVCLLLLSLSSSQFNRESSQQSQYNEREVESNSNDNNLGGQRDEHGCLGGAGYSWNSSEQRCVREWSSGEDRYQNDQSFDDSGIGQELREQIRERKEELRAGEYNTSLGQMLKVREMAQNLRELRVNNAGALTKLNISAEIDEEGKATLKVRLRNGEEREIKVMPNTASERAIERLRLKNCNEENNCTIELKEVGINGRVRAVYEVKAQKEARVLSLFRTRIKVQAQIDAETGEIIQTKKPWWAFLATTNS